MNTCQVCGSNAITTHSEAERIKHKDSFITVNMPYSICGNCSREFVSKEQIKVGDALIREAKKAYDGLYTNEEIKEARLKLGLTQAEASELFGGGRNAFSKYERGEVSQSVAMDRLIKLCVLKQETFEDLKAIANPTTTALEADNFKKNPIKFFSFCFETITERYSETFLKPSNASELNLGGILNG